MSAVIESTPTLRKTPALHAGDFLSREEFLRRWTNEPRIKRAELLKGIVYMPSPVSIDHGAVENFVGGWICVYNVETPGTAAGNNATTFLGEETPQPDVHLRLERECGGRSWVEDGYLHGSPELTVEVCASSAAYDLHVKFDLYQQAGVQEYLAIVLHEREIRWHQLVDRNYRLIPPDQDGVLRSRIFPGLWLDGAALLAGEKRGVMDKLDEGIASPEHRAFVEDLARRRTS